MSTFAPLHNQLPLSENSGKPGFYQSSNNCAPSKRLFYQAQSVTQLHLYCISFKHCFCVFALTLQNVCYIKIFIYCFLMSSKSQNSALLPSLDRGSHLRLGVSGALQGQVIRVNDTVSVVNGQGTN